MNDDFGEFLFGCFLLFMMACISLAASLGVLYLAKVVLHG